LFFGTDYTDYTVFGLLNPGGRIKMMSLQPVAENQLFCSCCAFEVLLFAFLPKAANSVTRVIRVKKHALDLVSFQADKAQLRVKT
jgi:hypothetical protein